MENDDHRAKDDGKWATKQQAYAAKQQNHFIGLQLLNKYWEPSVETELKAIIFTAMQAQPKPSKKLKLYKRPLLSMSLFVATLQIAMAYAYVFDPKFFSWASVVSLGFPLVFLANLLLLFIAIMRYKIYFVIPLVSCLLAYPTIHASFQINKPEKETPATSDIVVMSYNVRVFDLYNWTKNHETKAKIIEHIDAQNPNILCIQEFFNTDRKQYFNTLDTLLEVLKIKYHHEFYSVRMRNTDRFGITILSKYPILAKGVIDFETKGSNSCIYADLLINEDTVRVYNMHLASLHFAQEDYKFLEKINEENNETRLQGSKKILGRIRNAVIERSLQAEKVAAHIEKCTYSKIVCGDFNDTPTSYAYNIIKGDLTDSFTEKGLGFGTTYNGLIPLLRIDYILHSSDYVCTNFKSNTVDYSDHFPIVSVLRKAPTEAE